jgi:hypothetical protein
VRVSEKQVAQVVGEISSGAGDPQHVASVVGAFMQRQPTIGHYVSAHAGELSLEGVVLTLLHAAVLARCVEVAAGRRLGAVAAAELDAAAARAADEGALKESEPELHGYLVGNLAPDDATLGGARRAVALKLLRTIAGALLDSGRFR